MSPAVRCMLFTYVRVRVSVFAFVPVRFPVKIVRDKTGHSEHWFAISIKEPC